MKYTELLERMKELDFGAVDSTLEDHEMPSGAIIILKSYDTKTGDVGLRIIRSTELNFLERLGALKIAVMDEEAVGIAMGLDDE